jgi:acyl-CoA reductase-like NAD-dependent aldehyde dehydrogenase
MLDRLLYVDGEWVGTGDGLEVRNKYSGKLVGTVPLCDQGLLDRALDGARRAARPLAEMPAHRRSEILRRAAALLAERAEELARTIAAEAGKALKYARAEVERAVSVFALAAEEARRIGGEVVPLDAVPSGEGFFGFWQRRPVGPVAAITPFNFPLNLVAHKVAPALAAGCPVVVKPASATPLSALMLAEILAEAGVPPGALHVVVGSGRTLGEALAGDPRIAKVSFTGSREVGRRLTQVAGIKKITLELGNNSPVVLSQDADLDLAARRCALGAYYNSGQVCISVQRIYTPRPLHLAFAELFVGATRALVVGDPLDERVDVGPMIDVGEAERLEGWVEEARSGGATLAEGGRREGAVFWPTVLLDATPAMKVVNQEVFGPVASLMAVDSFEEALEQARSEEHTSERV